MDFLTDIETIDCQNQSSSEHWTIWSLTSWSPVDHRHWRPQTLQGIVSHTKCSLSLSWETNGTCTWSFDVVLFPLLGLEELHACRRPWWQTEQGKLKHRWPPSAQPKYVAGSVTENSTPCGPEDGYRRLLVVPFGCGLLNPVMLTWESTREASWIYLLLTWPAASWGVGSWSHCGHGQAEVPLQKSMMYHRREYRFKVLIEYLI